MDRRRLKVSGRGLLLAATRGADVTNDHLTHAMLGAIPVGLHRMGHSSEPANEV